MNRYSVSVNRPTIAPRRWIALAAMAGLLTAISACGSDSGGSGSDQIARVVTETASETTIETEAETAAETEAGLEVETDTDADAETEAAAGTTAAGRASEGTLVLESVSGQIGSAISSWMAETGAPAVTLALTLDENVLGGGQLVIAEGFADLVEQRSVTSEDLFRFGSITKPMTSTLVLQLVQEGLVELDTPVAEYLGDDWISGYVLDGVDYGPLVTVRQILDHTDGFAEFAFDLGFYAMVSGRLETPLAPQEIVDWAGSRGPQFIPGTDYNYNTVGHVVAGLVIEEITGRDAADVMAERLFVPAGAADAYLPPTRLPSVDTVNGYVEGPLKIAIQNLAGFDQYADAAIVGEFLDVSVAPQEVLRTAGWTGGGLEATALSTARAFSQMFDPITLTPETVEVFTTPWDGAATGYGLGISRGETEGYVTYSHGGAVPGFRSDAVYLPELGLTLAVSVNLLQVNPDIGALSSAVLAIVTKAVAEGLAAE